VNSKATKASDVGGLYHQTSSKLIIPFTKVSTRPSKNIIKTNKKVLKQSMTTIFKQPGQMREVTNVKVERAKVYLDDSSNGDALRDTPILEVEVLS